MTEDNRKFQVTYVRDGKTYVAQDLTISEAWQMYSNRVCDPACGNVSFQTMGLQADEQVTIPRSDPRHPLYLAPV